jgi:hypothetical protein
MFQFPRYPPELPQVPGRAPGGLPHSETPGSPAASASPGHFAAWPRPSSAANAKASTMRPSCGGPHPSPSRPDRSRGAVSCRTGSRQQGRCPPSRQPGSAQPRVLLRSRPDPARLLPSARSTGDSRPQPPARPGAARRQHLSVVCVCVCVVCAVRAGDPTRASSHRFRHWPKLGPRSPSGDPGLPAAAEPNRFRVAHCQGAIEVVKPRQSSRNLPSPAL